ncbi:MAG: hypothetical protein B9S35_14230 [Opitutia bacterium Tous-C5TDCM]|jgi:hypothetical protein|nr:MAG: hypothetical protein B9S35_14230 [Opitutae bacterium Tous-C5TDCM]
MTTSLTIQLDDRVRQRYARASRRLRQALGGEAPTTEQLIAHELSDRASQLIVEDFFETRKKQRRR